MFDFFSKSAIHIMIILVVVLLCNRLLSMILYKIKKYKVFNEWMTLLLDAAYMPVQSLMWIFGIIAVYYQLGHQDTLFFSVKYVDQMQQAACSIAFCWFLFRVKKSLETFIVAQHAKLIGIFDPALIVMLSAISKVTLVGISATIVLYLLGIPLQSLMMFQGAVSIAVGFAAQNVLGNGFGGLMIMINRPFKVGDLISSPDKEIEGYVEEIRWDSTKIMDLDRRPLYIPNSVFTQIIISNSSHMYNRHILQAINLRYEDVDKVQVITQDIQTMLRLRDDIDQDQIVAADWIDFGSQALKIEVTAFTKTTDKVLFRKAQQDVCVQIAHIVKKHGAEIAIISHLV